MEDSVLDSYLTVNGTAEGEYSENGVSSMHSLFT